MFRLILFVVEGCRKKWKNLKDTYMSRKRKCKAEKKSGKAAKKLYTWRYFNFCSFLDPVITDAK